MTTFSAVILAGGMSRRFGSPKAHAPFLGRPMLAWVVDAASAEADEIIIVGAKGQVLPQLVSRSTLIRVDDDIAHEGPLAGIRTGLRAASGEWVFALGCDMPLLTGALLAALAGLPRDADALVPQVDGRTQTLAALYHKETALRAFEDAWSRGERSVRGALDGLRIVEPEPGDLGPVDLVRMAMRSANTPEDLVAMETWASLHGGVPLGWPKPGSGGGSIGS